MFKVNTLFIIWLFALFLQACNLPVGIMGECNVIHLSMEHQGFHKNSFRNVRSYQCIPGSNWNLEILV